MANWAYVTSCGGTINKQKTVTPPTSVRKRFGCKIKEIPISSALSSVASSDSDTLPDLLEILEDGHQSSDATSQTRKESLSTMTDMLRGHVAGPFEFSKQAPASEKKPIQFGRLRDTGIQRESTDDTFYC